ncbi:MAG: hypothetical protein H7A19_04360 [Rhodanobacteraceae bacterium]|nr:hypothetical protein [Rhodanobacteraceae bacterium]
MQQRHLRAWLPTALALTLVACGGDDPKPAQPVPETADATAPGNSMPAAVPVPVANTAFEKGITELARGASVHFESELSLPDGRIQYASGVGHEEQYAFTVRSLPQPDPNADGAWYMRNGKYLRQTANGYDESMLTPESVTIMVETLKAFPRSEADLSAPSAPPDQADGISCQPREVAMGASPRLLGRFQAMGVCVDESNAHVIKLSATSQAGSRLSAVFSKHGEAVQLPDLKVADWTQEYPRRK